KVEVLTLCDGEEARNRRRIEVEVGVDERNPFAVRGEGARLYRITLSEVPVIVDDADTVGARLEQPFRSAVDRAVGNYDELDLFRRQSRYDRCANRLDVRDDVVSAVVDGNHDRKRRTGARSLGLGGGHRGTGRGGASHRADCRCRTTRP